MNLLIYSYHDYNEEIIVTTPAAACAASYARKQEVQNGRLHGPAQRRACLSRPHLASSPAARPGQLSAAWIRATLCLSLTRLSRETGCSRRLGVVRAQHSGMRDPADFCRADSDPCRPSTLPPSTRLGRPPLSAAVSSQIYQPLPPFRAPLPAWLLLSHSSSRHFEPPESEPASAAEACGRPRVDQRLLVSASGGQHLLQSQCSESTSACHFLRRARAPPLQVL